MIDISQKEHNFQESFEQFGGLALNSGPFQFSNLLQLLDNKLCQDSNISFFEKVNKRQLKMVNVNYLKWPDVAMLSFQLNHKRAWN